MSDYTGVINEDLDRKLDLILEAIPTLATKEQLRSLEVRVTKLEQMMDLVLRTLKEHSSELVSLRKEIAKIWMILNKRSATY